MLDGAARTVTPTASLLQPSRLLRWQVEVFPVSPRLDLMSLGLASPTPYREPRLLELHTSSATSDICSWLCPDLCTPSRRICKQAGAFHVSRHLTSANGLLASPTRTRGSIIRAACDFSRD
jgi:hypothetical protein